MKIPPEPTPPCFAPLGKSPAHHPLLPFGLCEGTCGLCEPDVHGELLTCTENCRPPELSLFPLLVPRPDANVHKNRHRLRFSPPSLLSCDFFSPLLVVPRPNRQNSTAPRPTRPRRWPPKLVCTKCALFVYIVYAHDIVSANVPDKVQAMEVECTHNAPLGSPRG